MKRPKVNHRELLLNTIASKPEVTFEDMARIMGVSQAGLSYSNATRKHNQYAQTLKKLVNKGEVCVRKEGKKCSSAYQRYAHLT